MHEHTLTAGAPSAPATRLGPLRFLTLPRLVFALLFLFLIFKVELSDPDYFWHLKTGEYIATHWGFPNGDPFSYTFEGKPWAPHEWLFQVGLFGVFALAGATGVKLAVALLGTASVYLAFRTASRLLGGSSVALLLAAACFMLLLPWFVPRPHLVTYVLVATFVDLLIGFKYFGEDRRLWLVGPLMVLWTNVHGAFVIGIALLGLFCACEWAKHWFGRPDAINRRRLVRLSAATLVGILATAVNPRGFDAWLFPAQLLDSSPDTVLPGEFHSPDFHTLYGKIFLAMAFGFFAVSIYRRTRPDLTEIAMPMCSLFIGFTANRHVPIAVLMLVPFLAVGLRDNPAQRLYARLAGSGKSLGNTEFALNAVLLCLVAATLVLLSPAEQSKAQERLNKLMPVKAVQFIRSHDITGRMFNDYTQGGYLLYHLSPQKVFIDGRGDIYGNAFINEFRTIRSGEPGWEKAFDKYAIDYLIVQRDVPIRGLLLARGDFKLVYDDETSSVLVRKLARFEKLAEQKPN